MFCFWMFSFGHTENCYGSPGKKLSAIVEKRSLKTRNVGNVSHFLLNMLSARVWLVKWNATLTHLQEILRWKAALFPSMCKNESNFRLRQKKHFSSKWSHGHVEYKVVNPCQIFLPTSKKAAHKSKKLPENFYDSVSLEILECFSDDPAGKFLTKAWKIFSQIRKNVQKKLQTNR